MSLAGKILLSVLLCPLIAGASVRAAEFEVLDRFSVDGYSVLRGSADIPGGSFAVGGTTFVVKGGNVGIGTTGPGAKLDVQGNITGTQSGNSLYFPLNALNVDFTDAGGSAAGLAFGVGGMSNRKGALVYERKGSWGIGDFHFLQNTEAGSGALPTLSQAVLTIRSNGKVGIGTTGPGASFHVVSTDTVSTAFKVQTGSIPGTAVEISTSGDLNVAGGIKAGTVTASCSSAIAGTIRWTNGHLSVCNGSDWRQLDNQPPPVVLSINPASGIIFGATAITLGGSGFTATPEVNIGGNLATGVTWVASSQITATTPASTTGTGAKVVTITNPDGQYCTTSFTYNPLPTIETVSPAAGPQLTIITITGTGFLSGTGLAVEIGGVAATGVTWVSAAQITATAPASAVSGAKDVKVTNPDTGAATKSGGFTYRVYATGGTLDTTVPGYRIHKFTGSGTFTVATGGNVEVLVVAGGGGTGYSQYHNGGGGGGGVVYHSAKFLSSGGITVTVGDGGTGGPGTGTPGTNGGNSVFGDITAIGGGYGGAYSTIPGNNGGSGGGGAENGGEASHVPGNAIQGNSGGGTGYGHNGGAGFSGGQGAGGGGGAGTSGGVGVLNSRGGTGGDGFNSSISGLNVYYGGGGGGANYYGNTTSSGGLGGGGTGFSLSGGNGAAGSANGAANTGGGAGGYERSDLRSGGSGGSGIVIVRYPN